MHTWTSQPQKLCSWPHYIIGTLQVPERWQRSIWSTHLPGVDTVPRVIKRVTHYVCIWIMQLSEHLKRDCSLINFFWLLSTLWISGSSKNTDVASCALISCTYAADLIVSKCCVWRIHHHNKLHLRICHVAVSVQLLRFVLLTHQSLAKQLNQGWNTLKETSWEKTSRSCCAQHITRTRWGKQDTRLQELYPLSTWLLPSLITPGQACSYAGR